MCKKKSLFLLFLSIINRIKCKQKSFNIPYEMEENKKLEAIVKIFKELSYDERREKVISLVEWLWEADVYADTLSILKEFQPSDEYLENIYRAIMENKLSVYESWKEKEKLDAQQKMQEYMKKLNELSLQKKQEDEKEADDLLNMIE